MFRRSLGRDDRVRRFPMRRVVRVLVVDLLSIASVLALAASPAAASAPIKPNQHFFGLVNGSKNKPVVYTVCAGPIWEGRTGPVAGGQTMSVARSAKGEGYTGPFRQVYAWFAQDTSGTPPQTLTFTRYGVPQPIPPKVRVPCDGPGQAEFSSCPYLAPCAAGFVPDIVDVLFVNIAA
jgi:hypothetical protein